MLNGKVGERLVEWQRAWRQPFGRWRRLAVAAGLVLCLLPGLRPALAQTAPGCASGEKPAFKGDLGRLADRLSYATVGDPVECSRTDASGDTVQRTSTGSLGQAKSSTVPVFHRGQDHWALLTDGSLFQWSGDSTAVPSSAREGVPGDIRATFPAGAKPVSSAYANFTGRGDREWAVLYTVSGNSGGKDASVGVFARVPGGWFNLRTFLFESVNGATLDLTRVDAVPAIAVATSVGAHGSQLTVVRWDGANFVSVLDVSSNAPAAATLRDLDHDGTPEVLVGWSPYCESYAASPRLTTVFRWNGSTYVEATGSFPDVVAGSASDVLAAFGTASGWSATGRACLHWALGYLAEAVGDVDTAAAQYGRARAVDPNYDLGKTAITPTTPNSMTPTAPFTAATPTATPTAAQSPTSTPTATRGGQPTPTTTKTPPPALRVGGIATVTGVAPDRLNVRSAPALNADIVATLNEGVRVKLLEGPRSADGRTWWRVALESDGASLGWAVQDYLVPSAAVPGLPPPVTSLAPAP